MPGFVGISSENAAHRIAVEWDEDGETREGVFIPRRDTNSTLNALAGGTLFPGEHNLADFTVIETDAAIDFSMLSRDETVKVDLSGTFSDTFPSDSIFDSLDDSSGFFEKGSLGYSVTKGQQHLDGITLDTKQWAVEPLSLSTVHSSFYEDETIFPKGTIEFDHALLMRNIEHEWHSAPDYELS